MFLVCVLTFLSPLRSLFPLRLLFLFRCLFPIFLNHANKPRTVRRQPIPYDLLWPLARRRADREIASGKAEVVVRSPSGPSVDVKEKDGGEPHSYVFSTP